MTALPIRVKLLPGGRLPVRATPGASGWDLFACCNDAGKPYSMTVAAAEPGRTHARFSAPVVRIPLGVAFEIPPGFEGQLRARSSLGAKGLVIPNGVGTIDSDYRGEVAALYLNLSGEDFVIRDGDRVAQIVFAPVPDVRLEQVDALGETQRGAGGFGSTGSGRISWENENRPANAPRESLNEALSKCPIAFSEEALPPKGSGPLARAPTDEPPPGRVFGAEPAKVLESWIPYKKVVLPDGVRQGHSQPDLFRSDGDEGAPLGDPDE